MESLADGHLPPVILTPQKLDFAEVFTEVCCGNRDAHSFCVSFLVWVQLIDDVIDKDKPLPDAEMVIRINLEAMMTFAFNPFWQEHKAALTALVVQSVKAYADSLEWAKRPDFRDRATADVLKSQYQEVFWHVARICGGYDHMDRVTKRFRHYQHDATY